MRTMDAAQTATSFSGLLFVNKPSGPTSFDLIRWLRRSHKGLKVGHAGTLDPIASGLMILLVGRATKDQDRFMKLDKSYVCDVQLGARTDSGDRTGTVVESKGPPADLTRERVAEALAEFVGPQQQIPPMYAAIKKDGVPLYKLARKGVTVEREPRSIVISAIELLEAKLPRTFRFRVHCSSGTYVRTLVEDVAARLGTVGTMAELVREQVGPYSLADALPGERLKSLSLEDLNSSLKAVEK